MQNEWTTDLIDSLLRHPSELANDPLYVPLINKFGGLAHIYKQFKALKLKSNLSELLTVILEHPYATIDWYADTLVIHRATFYRHYKALIQALLEAFQRGIIQPVPATSQQDVVNPFPLPMLSTTTLIGRSDELTQIKQLIENSDTRLITLVGPGGIGKTRLAQHIAWETSYLFPDGMLWIDLVPLQNATSVVSTLAYQLNIKGPDTQDLFKSIQEWLKSRHMGIVFDNCEHIMDVVPIIQTLLSHIPQLKIITTSRRVLGLYGEHRVVITPLSLTIPPQRPFAMDLFLSRSAAHGVTIGVPDYPHVTAICEQLDGMPLAIELAATHVGKIPLAMMKQRLHEQVVFLSTSQEMNDERHTSLEATLRWSIELLPKQVQTLFMYLAVFQGSWGIEPLYEICKEFEQHEVDYMLRILTDHQLVQIEPSFPSRYRLLEPVRAFATQLITQSPHKDELFSRHAQAFCCVTQQLFEQRYALRDFLTYYTKEYANISSAIKWLFAHDIQAAFDCFYALWPYWSATPTITDGATWLEKLKPFVHSISNQQQARFWHTAGIIYNTLMNTELAQAAFKKALAQYQYIGDVAKYATMLSNIGVTALHLNNLDQAVDYYLQSISMYEQYIDLQNETTATIYAIALSNLALVYTFQHKLNEALYLNILAYDIYDYYNVHNIELCLHIFAQINIKKQKYEEALQLIKDLPINFPNIKMVMSSHAIVLFYIYLGLKNYKEAFKALNDVYMDIKNYISHLRNREFILCCAYLLYAMNCFQESIMLYAAVEYTLKYPLAELKTYDTIWLHEYQQFRAQVAPEEWAMYYEQGRSLNKMEAWKITQHCLAPLFMSDESKKMIT